MVSQKLSRGNYKIILEFINAVNTGETDDLNEIDCKLPNLYFNIALHPYAKLKQLIPNTLDGYQEGYPDISDINESLASYSQYTATYSKNYIRTFDIPNEDSVLKLFEIKNPALGDEMRDFGFTGI